METQEFCEKHGEERDNYRCRSCKIEYDRAYYAKNREERLKKSRAYNARLRATPEGIQYHKEYQREYVASGRAREAWLKRTYGITATDFEAMLEAQGGGCAICGAEEPKGRNWHIDHDHSCCPGKGSCGECIRGLLCFTCNRGLGDFQDDPEFLRAAVGYLEEGRLGNAS